MTGCRRCSGATSPGRIGRDHRRLLHPDGGRRAARRALSTARQRLDARAPGAVAGPSARHRRSRPRRALAPSVGRPVARCSRPSSRWRSRSPSACRSAWSPAISAAGSTSSISRLTDTLLAVPGIMLAISLALFLGGSLFNATLAIARRRGSGLHPPGARPHHSGPRRALYRGGALGRPADLPAPLRSHPAEPRAADHRPGDAGDGGRRHRRGEPVVPRPRAAAAGAVAGARC